MRSYVLITGATGGLGKAFAAACAARGWDLFLTDLSDRRLDALATGLARLYGVEVVTHSCDLTEAAARDGLWGTIDRLGARFHMLINVAGLDYEGPFDERRPSELQTIVRLNVESTLDTTRRSLVYRDVHRTFRIITVSSLAAFYPMPVKAVYAASKRFLLDWSRALGEELRDRDVTVTALCPAGMPTTPACVRSIEAQGLMGRWTTKGADDVAALTLRRAMAGRRVVVPGFLNQVMRVFGAMVPRAVLTAMLKRRWLASHRVSHGQVPVAMTPVVVNQEAAQ
ncbi:MAG: SDR family NAD(P)-dependent oxidoreductase [Anaerolineae bacterium]|nr:SDR family NAD(P)-dependent oxidoreductase [Anaerolineae bacterium]